MSSVRKSLLVVLTMMPISLFGAIGSALAMGPCTCDVETDTQPYTDGNLYVGSGLDFTANVTCPDQFSLTNYQLVLDGADDTLSGGSPTCFCTGLGCRCQLVPGTGPHSVAFTCLNNSGGSGGTVTFSVTSSTVPPAVAVTSVPLNNIAATTAAISGTIQQGLIPVASLQLILANSTTTAYTSNTPSNGPWSFVLQKSDLLNGLNVSAGNSVLAKLNVVATDIVGNSTSVPAGIYFDGTAPKVAITNPPNGSSNTATMVGIAGTASDDSGIASVKLVIQAGPGGQYWSGANFDAPTATVVKADLGAPFQDTFGNSVVTWTYGGILGRFLDSGVTSYIVTAMASDDAGNQGSASSFFSGPPPAVTVGMALNKNAPAVPLNFFAPPNYGQQGLLCVTLPDGADPSLLRSLVFISADDAFDSFSAPVQDGSCGDKYTVRARVSDKLCIGSGTVFATYNGTQVLGTANTQIVLPTTESSTKLSGIDHNCPVGSSPADYCIGNDYSVHFSPGELVLDGSVTAEIVIASQLNNLPACQSKRAPLIAMAQMQNGFVLTDLLGFRNPTPDPIMGCGEGDTQTIFVGLHPETVGDISKPDITRIPPGACSFTGIRHMKTLSPDAQNIFTSRNDTGSPISRSGL